jgi:2-phosphoglycerate kinase
MGDDVMTVTTVGAKPVILLIGGATGTGKSTVAAEVAHRLGVTRVTSTDVVRQTLRAVFAEEYMPSIHRSSFDPGDGQPLIERFVEQTANVLTAMDATIARALEERWSMVLEGVHLVPGMVTLEPADALYVQCVLTIADEETHASHFWIRDATSNGMRPVKKYLERLHEIRRLQEFIRGRAEEANVPVIENVGVEQTVGAVIDLVLRAAAGELQHV